MTDKALLVASLTADDRLDDVARARIWARLEPRIDEPRPRRARWSLAIAAACSLAALGVAVVLVTRSPDGRTLTAPGDATLTTHLGPHTRASLVGPAQLHVVGSPGDVTTVRLDHGTLLAEFTGGPGRALHVEAPGMRVDVVGTLFSVEIQPARTCVAVAHGRVEVEIASRRTAVATGQELCTHDPAPTAIEPHVREALERHGAIVAVAAPVVAPPPSAVPMPPEPPTMPPAPPTVPPAPLAPSIASRPMPSPAASAPRNEPRTAALASAHAGGSPPVEPAPPASSPAQAQPEPPRDPAPAAPAKPPPPTADELYRAAEAALARRDVAAADRALAQLVATSPASSLVGQATYERARIAYERHAWADARRHLEALAQLGDPALAESGRYLTCRIAVEAHDGDALRCLGEFRSAYPASAHDRDVLGTIAQLAFATGGCTAAASAITELAARYPHSTLAAAWRAKCSEAR